MKIKVVLALVSVIGYFLFCAPVFSDPVAEEKKPDAVATLPAEDLLRSNLQLQDQLHTALKAIERIRQDVETASQNNSDIFSERINSVEKNLNLQREHDLESMISMRQSNRLALMAAAVVAGIGLLSLFVTAIFQVRAMNKMAAVGTLISAGSNVSESQMLGDGSEAVPARLNTADQATTRFLSAIAQLERRIHELDSLNSAATEFARASAPKPQVDWAPAPRPVPTPDTASQVRMLLAEGQSDLKNGDPNGALAYFEKAVDLDPNNAEALVKKGTALEAQRKLHEAIESYDRAIAADTSLTVAYLYKGGALNRLQRFSEAMTCYEQALRNHTKKAA